MLNPAGKVIEDFKPTYNKANDLDFDLSLINDKWTYSFTMNDIETLGCAESATTNKDGNPATLYTCDISMHFYYDYDQTFATK